MSKFKLGDLIRPKDNPTYLPDEVWMVIGFSDSGEYADAIKADGSEKFSAYKTIDEWQLAYPVPILVGDTVRVNPNVKLFDMLSQCPDAETIERSVTFFIQAGCSCEYTVSRSDDGLVFVDAPYEMPVHSCLFNLISRADAKVMTHAEIEAALGFRFELED